MSLTKVTNAMIANAPIDVENFGAVGDGTTDDSAAIQSAVNSITSQGIINLDAGKTYKIVTTISIGSKNIEFAGPSSIVLGANVSAFTVAGGVLQIHDVAFTTGTSATGIIASATTPSRGIFLRNTSTGLRSGFSGYWNESLFDGNDLYCLPASSAGGYLIHIPGSNNRVVNNRLRGGRHHVYISGGPYVSTDPTAQNIVQGNICVGAGFGAIACYAKNDQGGVYNNHIINNTIISTISGHPIDVNTYAVNNTVSNNHISVIPDGYAGIHVEGAANLTAGTNRPHQNVISGNTIFFGDSGYSLATHGIQLLNAYDNIVNSNSIYCTYFSAYVFGISLDSQSTPKDSGNQVTGNSLANCQINNATIDGTLIAGNSIAPNSSQTTSIFIDVTGTAQVSGNVLGAGVSYTTFTDGATTPTVAKNNYFFTANTSATSITYFSSPYPGQEVTIVFKDSNTTLIDVTGGSGRFRLQGAANHTYATNDVATFVYSVAGDVWYEASRSHNS